MGEKLNNNPEKTLKRLAATVARENSLKFHLRAIVIKLGTSTKHG